MRVWVDDEGWVELEESALLAEGGQGRVYGLGARAYKIAFDPSTALDPAKLAVLAAIPSDAIVRPQASIRSAPRAAPIGHTMARIERAVPWMQLVPRSAKQRLGIDRDAALELCARLQALVSCVHAHGIAIVDLSAGNVLVDVRRQQPFLIDLDSAQTPGFPATAITPQIADPLASGRFGAASDWFAFAVLSFELLVGVHPYRGTHPSVVGLEARMAAGLSVLDSAVRVPPVGEDPRTLPAALLRHFEETFAHRHRGPAPLAPAVRIGLGSRPRVHRDAACIASSDGAAIRGVLPGATTWWWTDTHVGFGHAGAGGGVLGPTPRDAVGLVHVPGTAGVAMLCHGDDGALHLHDPATGGIVDLRAKVSAVRVDGGAIAVRQGDRVGVLELRAPAGPPWASVRSVGRSPAAGSTLWPGCATSRRLGCLRLQTIDVGGSASREIHGLAGARVVDAAAADGIAVLLVADGHRFDRWVVGIRPDRPIQWVERDVDPVGCAIVQGHDGATWVRLAAGLARIGASGIDAARVDVGQDRVLGVPQGALRLAHAEVWEVRLAGSTNEADRQTRASAC
jgi:hypothetical protein